MLLLRAKNKYSVITNKLLPGYTVVEVAAECSGENCVSYYEIVKNENIDAYFEELEKSKPVEVKEPEKKDTTVDDKVVECLDTVLNTDPFGFGYSGYTLRKIFKVDKNHTWINMALSKMKNPFIRERIEYLIERLSDNSTVEIVEKYLEEER